MAQATVAGPNHSTYSNLPDEGYVSVPPFRKQFTEHHTLYIILQHPSAHINTSYSIMYIAHVCRRVLGHAMQNEDHFWDVFRE